jgi:hypothetical protein
MTKFRKPSARVLSAQHLTGLRVHQMPLSARKARHFGVISRQAWALWPVFGQR